MSEACLGLGPNGWAYVSSLIKDGRATGVSVYIDEPYPQIAESAACRQGFLIFSVLAVQIIGFAVSRSLPRIGDQASSPSTNVTNSATGIRSGVKVFTLSSGSG